MDFPRAYVVFDTETTGPPPAARMVEIGAIKVRGRHVVARFESLLFPERAMPAPAQAIHGLTDAALAKAPTAGEVLPGFLAWTEGLPLVAHNAAFDAAVLGAEAARGNLRLPSNQILCSLQAARRLLCLRSFRLEDLVAQLQLPTGPHHRAAADAQHTLHLWWKLQDWAPRPLPGRTLGPARPLHEFAPRAPRLPAGRRGLGEALVHGWTVDFDYHRYDHRVIPCRVTPRFVFHRAQSGHALTLEGICHELRLLRHYELDRIFHMRLRPDEPAVEIRRTSTQTLRNST